MKCAELLQKIMIYWEICEIDAKIWFKSKRNWLSCYTTMEQSSQYYSTVDSDLYGCQDDVVEPDET